MAIEIPLFNLGILPAAADLSAKQYKPVKIATYAAGQLGCGVDVLSATGGIEVLGLLQNAPVAGEAATVQVHGVSKAIIEGSVTFGNALTGCPAGLRAAASGNYQHAIALESGSDGNTISVLLIRNGIKA